MRPAPVTLLGSGLHENTAVLWRMQGTLHVTVIVKATFALVHEGPAHLVAAREITFAERPVGGAPGRSLEAASDLAPHKSRTDVTFVGHAHPPGGQPAPTLAVRLALYRDKALLDKTLRVYGDRSGDRPTPEPFRAMPLSYERAYGGSTFPANPVGIGADARVRAAPGAPTAPDATSALPNIVDPNDPTKPAGFAPISEQWTARRRILGTLDPAILEAPIATVPSAQIFAYFQSAPPDQQIEYLRGDEWIVLDNLHPTLPRISSRLPGIRGACQLYMPDATGRYAAGRPLPMRLDTLAIDGSAQHCSLVFRTNFPVLGGESALADLRVACGLEGPGQTLSWPDPAELSARPAPAVGTGAPSSPVAPAARTAAPSKPLAPAGKKPLEGTAALSNEQQEWLARQRAAPFAGAKKEPPAPPAPPAPKATGRVLTGTAAISDEDLAEALAAKAVPFGDKPPEVPVPVAPRVPVSAPPRVPVSPAPATAKALERTGALGDEELKELQRAREGGALPFSRKETAPEVAASSRRPAAPRSSALTGTAALSDADLLILTRIEPLPFVFPPSPPSPPKATAGPLRAKEPPIPARRSATIPIASPMPLTAMTVPWQVRPPKSSITVVVKGSFEIVQDAAAVWCPEPEAVSGDLHIDDDPEKNLLAAADTAFFKPKADVIVSGFAHAGSEGARVGQVTFSFTHKERRIDRKIAVSGPRTFRPGLVGRSAPSEPQPFDRIRMSHENAFGGPALDDNPAGAGHQSWPDGEAQRRPPHLEDPAKPVTSPADVREPACLAPISPTWKARRNKLGTYDRKWLETRWPYFPEDFDWAFFQHAPPSQQVPYLRGDERFEVSGMRPRGAVVKGRLPGLRARCFAERSEAHGGGFSEVPLHLDTAVLDMEATRIHLVWRGVVEVTGDDAPELACLLVLAEPLDAAPMSMDAARAVLLGELTPKVDSPERPEPKPKPANDVAPAPQAEDPRDAATTALLEQVEARQAALWNELKQAGVPGEMPRGEPPAPAPLDPDRMAAHLRLAGASDEEVATLMEALQPPPPPKETPPEPIPGVREKVLRWLAAGVPLDGKDMSGGDLSGLDFAGKSMVGANLKGCLLVGCAFEKARMVEAQMSKCDLTDAILSGADLTGADLTGARLTRASFEGALLDHTDLSSASGEGAVFRKARGTRTQLAGGTWTGASFEEALLPGADFSAALLDDAQLTEAALAGARFYDARGSRVRLDGVLLENGRASGVTLTDSTLREIIAPSSDWEDAVLDGSTFFGANLRGAGFNGASCKKTVFSSVDAPEARFARATLTFAPFLKSNLRAALFEKADLTDADLRGACLHEAEVWRARLERTRLDGAIVTRSKLEDMKEKKR